MNNDLIRRSDTLKSIANDGDEHWWYEERVNEVPAVDAVEVVHAKWELEYETYGKTRCSACKEEAPKCELYGDVGRILAYVDSKFCPSCGARMDGK